MSRGPHTFKQRDLTRAIKGARAAGIDVARVVIDKQGRISIEIARGGSEVATENPWDQAVAEVTGGR